MGKVIRQLLLVSLFLLLGAAGIYGIGEWQYWYEGQQFEKRMWADGYSMSEAYPDTNAWIIVGGLLFLVSVSVALAAFILWIREREDHV